MNITFHNNSLSTDALKAIEIARLYPTPLYSHLITDEPIKKFDKNQVHKNDFPHCM